MMLQSFVPAAKAGVHLAAARARGRLPVAGGLAGGSGLSPGRRRRKATAALIFIVLGLALAGCGKKNAPSPPPGVPNTYPRTYPSV
jgi:hypothetical protein